MRPDEVCILNAHDSEEIAWSSARRGTEAWYCGDRMADDWKPVFVQKAEIEAAIAVMLNIGTILFAVP